MLHVLPRLEPDELGPGVLDLARATRRQGWRTVVACSGGALAHEPNAADGTIEVMPLGDRGPLARWRSLRALTAAGKRHGAVLVHAHEPSVAGLAEAAAERLGAGLVTSVHQSEDGKADIGRCGQRVIVASEHLAEAMAAMPGIARERLRTIPQGVDLVELDSERVRGHRVAALAERWNIGAEARILLLPAPLVEGYGHQLLLEAVALLGRKDLLLLFLGPEMAGNRHLRSLQDAMARQGVADQVRFAEDCPDMPAALQMADIVVLPATRPLPAARAVIAAQAMGKPVVVSNVGALPELVMPAMTGWLVPAGDVGELAWAIERGLSLEPEVRERLAERGRSFVRSTFDLERIAARTLDVYRELTEPARAGSVARRDIGAAEPAAD